MSAWQYVALLWQGSSHDEAYQKSYPMTPNNTPKIIMKTPHMLVGVLFAGLISTGFLSGCADTPAGPTLRGFRIGPTVFEGVTNYPANAGSTYYFGVTNYPYYPTNSGISYFNTPVDYTTNPPPPGFDDFVTVISTNNRFVMHSVDFDSPTNTGTLSK